MRTPNIEHRTPNIEWKTRAAVHPQDSEHWMFDVRCSMFDVPS